MQRMLITNSNIETQNAAENFSKELKGGEVIALYGDLGSGKTTFVQGLAKGLGIKRRIISPTFIIIRNYELRMKNHGLRFRNFYHVDLYRINSQKDIEMLGLSEIIIGRENIVAIEWAEKIVEYLPKERIDIYFEYLSDNKRKIKIEYAS